MKKLTLLATILGMLVFAAIPALAQMRNSEFDVTSAPASQYEKACTHHLSGEILVRYDTGGVEVLYFEDLAAIQDPCEQRAAMDERVREVLTWPGVQYAGVNTPNVYTGGQAD